MPPKTKKPSHLKLIDPSIVLGGLATLAFYGVIHQPAMRDSLLHHYTTEHVVEYAIVALFIWGMTDIVLKLFGFPRELLALRQDWLPPCTGRETTDQAVILGNEIRQKPHWLLESRMGRRLLRALDFAAENHSAEQYREQILYLADQDDETTHTAYTLPRFIVGITPILGFLGTVVHFGTALSGISFSELSDRLPAIVGSMGTAFNTTTVALAAAMTMMFLLFLCERIDRGITHAVDRTVERELMHRFDMRNPHVLPFLGAVQTAHEESLRAISVNLNAQVEVWTASLDRLFDRFEERRQHESLNWQQIVEALAERHAGYDADREERLRQILTILESRQERHLERLQGTLDQALSMREDFGECVNVFRSIADGEGKLAEVQNVLANNLRAIRETQQFDEALHGLTAAIHLLTARHHVGIHRDSAAA